MKKFYTVIFIILTVLLITSCNTSAKKETINPVQEYTVKRGPIVESIDVSGSIRAKDDITVKSHVSGIIKKVYVQEGDRVKKGDLIVEIEDDEYRLDYEKAKKAYEEVLISGSKSDIAIKKLEMDIAKKRLEETKIYAPFDGIVAEVYVDEGDVVGGNGTRIARVVSKDIYVEAAVDEVDYGKIEIGSRAVISFEALPEIKAMGQVSYISPVAVSNGGLVVFPIKVEIEKATNMEKLVPGMNCDISIIIANIKDALIIPSNALMPKEGKYYVKVKSGEKIEIKEVKVGYIGDFFAQVLSGLKEGDEIIIEKQFTLKNTLLNKGINYKGIMRRMPKK